MVQSHLFHKSQQGLSVVTPFFGQLFSIRVLATWQLYSDLKAVTVEIIIILHPTWNMIELLAY